MSRNITIPASNLYFELGHINAARKYCYEALTSFPYDPRVYKILILINLIDGKYVAAEKFIKILKRSLLYHKWADHYEKYINDHALCETDPQLAEKRNYIPEFQFFINKENKGIHSPLQ